MNLLRGGSDCFSYSEQAEYAVQQILCRRWPLLPGPMTEGYAPQWDIDISGMKIEVKFTSMFANGFNKIWMEYAYENGEPSGIRKCKADYFLLIVPGHDRNNEIVGKWHLVRRKEFIKYCAGVYRAKNNPKLRQNILKTFKGNGIGRGSRCVLIDIKTFSQKHPKWEIGMEDCGVIWSKDHRKIIGYDLTDIRDHVPMANGRYFVVDNLEKWFSSSQLQLA